MQCSEEGWDLYTEKTKQQLHKHTEEPPQEGKTQLYTCIWRTKDANIHIPDWDDRWFERGLKEDNYVGYELPTLNRGGGLFDSRILYLV